MFSPRLALRPLKSAGHNSRSIGTLVVVEHKNGKMAAGSLNALSAAKKFNQPVTALIAGSPGASLESVAKSTGTCEGVETIVVASHDAYGHGLAEPIANLVAETVKAGGFTQGNNVIYLMCHFGHFVISVVAAHSPFGKNILPRASALLDVSAISDVTEITPDGSSFTFKRPIYAGIQLFLIYISMNCLFLIFVSI